MFYCEKCGNGDACERTDLVNEPVLCDKCYDAEIYGDCDCDRCNNSYYLGDKMHCKVGKCSPIYDIYTKPSEKEKQDAKSDNPGQ